MKTRDVVGSGRSIEGRPEQTTGSDIRNTNANRQRERCETPRESPTVDADESQATGAL